MVRVSRFWRGLTVVALGCGLAGAGQLTALAAPATGLTITIGAKSALKPVTHDVLVIFRAGKDGKVTVKGQISGAVAGEIARLYALPFKGTAAPVPHQALTLSGATASYSFRATPSLATRYTVRVFMGATQEGTSKAATVYVATRQRVTGLKNCGQPTCHQIIHVFTAMPASAFKHESAKHWFVYFAVRRNARKEPPPIKWLNLDRHAKVSKVRRISAGEFERTITLTFKVGDGGWRWDANFCSKDTESADGINLPGHHGCGGRRVRATAVYIG
jgi:hypothetical protein